MLRMSGSTVCPICSGKGAADTAAGHSLFHYEPGRHVLREPREPGDVDVRPANAGDLDADPNVVGPHESRFRDLDDTERLERRRNFVELLYYEDGTDATVSVARFRSSPSRRSWVSGVPRSVRRVAALVNEP